MFKSLTFALLVTALSTPATAQTSGKGHIAGEKFSTQSGVAAIYSQKGGKTASGEASNPENLTAAHRSLPFGTIVRVTNPKTGRSVEVRINDRGPFNKSRVIDVTSAAAEQLGFSGLAPVRLEVLGR